MAKLEHSVVGQLGVLVIVALLQTTLVLQHHLDRIQQSRAKHTSQMAVEGHAGSIGIKVVQIVQNLQIQEVFSVVDLLEGRVQHAGAQQAAPGLVLVVDRDLEPAELVNARNVRGGDVHAGLERLGHLGSQLWEEGGLEEGLLAQSQLGAAVH